MTHEELKAWINNNQSKLEKFKLIPYGRQDITEQDIDSVIIL